MTKEEIDYRIKTWQAWKALVKLNPNKYYIRSSHDNGTYYVYLHTEPEFRVAQLPGYSYD